MQAGEDEYSDDDGQLTTKDGKPIPRFRLPKRLRGWMYLERVRIPPRDVPGILNQIQTTNITRLQKRLIDNYPDSLIKRLDADRSNNPPRKSDKINFVCMESEDQNEENYEDANQAYEEDWQEGGEWNSQEIYYYDDYNNVFYSAGYWYDDEEEEDDELDFYLDDENQVAFVTENGYFVANETVVDHVDLQHGLDDKEYAQAAIDFTSARSALSKARVARGFFPIVIPADMPSGRGRNRFPPSES